MRNIDFFSLGGRNNVVVYKIVDPTTRGKVGFTYDSYFVFGDLYRVGISLFAFELCESVSGFLTICYAYKDFLCVFGGVELDVKL